MTPSRGKVRRALLPIIDRKFQFKVTLLIVGIITITHLCFNIYIYYHVAQFAQKLADFVPDLAPDADWFRRLILGYMAFIVLTTFVAVILLSLYFSARISGPLFNMTRVFSQIADGDFSKRIQLRQYDELKDFSESANRLFAALEKREIQLKDLLSRLRPHVKADEGLKILEQAQALRPSGGDVETSS